MKPYDIRPPLGQSNASIVPYSPKAHHAQLSSMLVSITQGTWTTTLAPLFVADDSSEHLVALDATRVIGHVGLKKPDETLAGVLATLSFPGPDGWGYIEVEELFTDPQTRGSGWGTYLLGSALRSAQGAQCVPVISLLEEDSAAIAFVENFGLVYWGSYERDGALHYLYVNVSDTAEIAGTDSQEA